MRQGALQNSAKSGHPNPGWGRMGGLPFQLREVVHTSAGMMILPMDEDRRPVLEVSSNVCASTDPYTLKGVLSCVTSSSYLQIMIELLFHYRHIKYNFIYL